MLGLAVLPAVVDWGGDVVGIWQNSVGSRMVTGGIMGVAAGYFLVAAIADMVSQKRTSGSQHKESTP
jgi:zinc transporter ZupT